MRKITRESLDELEKTMSIIPMSELIRFLAGDTHIFLPSEFELDQYLFDWVRNPNYVELSFFYYDDGSCGIFIDSRNTASMNYVPKIQYTHDSNGGYYSYGGRVITGIGHTHDDDRVGASVTDITNRNRISDLPHYIFDFRGYTEY